MESYFFDDNLDYISDNELINGYNFISEFEARTNEEFISFIKEWLNHEQVYRKDLYSESFIQAAYQEIDEYPIAPCGLNCYMIPWHCLEAFYYSVNLRLPEKDQFDFEQYIPIEYYEQYDDVSSCCYPDFWFTLALEESDNLDITKKQIFNLTLSDKEKYYETIDGLLEDYKGKVKCVKKMKINILKECINFRQESIDEKCCSITDSLFIEDNKDWICLEIEAIKNKIKAIESNAMDTPLHIVDLKIITKLENWIGNLLDKDHRDSTKMFGMHTRLFLKRAFEKDSWQRYLLRKLGFEKSRIYLIAKHYNKRLPFPPVVEKD